tara:strand:+ start:148 stop:8115 length:7968 start_codon:yes stop_codon:yes gene_type:complete
LTNKVGKNENSYMVGAGIGKQSRFSRSALKRRASNNSFGECCDFNSKNVTIGTLIDGYIKNADGIIINMETNKIIELIKTDNLGNFTIRTSANVLPNHFKIKFTGGIDIATNLNNVLDLEAIYEKKEITNKLNVSILSTLITKIVENDITDIGTITKLRNVENMIADVFNLSVKQIKEDYILTENIDVTKVINQINVVLKTINSSYSSMPGNNIKESDILNEIGNIIKQDSSFNLLDLTYIDEIIENVITNNNLLASDIKKENLKKIVQRGNNIINDLPDNLSFEDFFIYSTKINVISSNYANSSNLDVTQAFDTINDVFDNNINTYPINTIYNSRSYNVYHIECTNFISNLNIINTLNGNKYVLNNNNSYDANKKYGINNGIYKITNIPESHPLAILNNNNQHLILYSGNPNNKTQSYVNNVLYDFYHGSIDVKVIGDFKKVSFYCKHHGYMGGEDILFYNTSCPSPPPIISLNGENNIIREVGFALNDPGATAVDRNDKNVRVYITSDLSLSFINNVPIIKTTGLFNLTYTATDNVGSTSQLIRSIQVVDTTDPTISLRPDHFGNTTNITLELGDNFIDPGYDASDNNSEPLLVTVVGLEAVNTNVKGIYTIEYTATDVDGHSTTETRTITVEDNIPPEITLIGDNPYIVELGDIYIESGANVFDKSDLTGDSIQLLITNNIPINENGNTNKNGTYMVRYEATDINNKQTIKFREIIVRDTTPPNITLLPNLNGTISPLFMELGEIYTEYGFYSSDILGILDEYHNSDNIDFSVAGTYHVVYTSFDLCNNKSENIRVIVVQDTQPPIITLSGDNEITVELGEDFIEPSYNVFDHSPYTLTRQIYSIDENNNQTQVQDINTSLKGRYVIAYTAVDNFSNSSFKTRTVTVRDSTGPVITLNGSNVIVIQSGENYEDEGASASDLGGGNVSFSVIGDVIDTSVLGTYNVIYKAVDEDLNETFLTRTVRVVDTTKPVVTLLPNTFGLTDFTIQAGSDTYTEYGADVFDNYDTNLTLDICYGISVDENGFFNSKQVGSYEIKYSTTDICGNISDIETRIVTIEDNIAPKITFEPYPGQADISQIILEIGADYVEYGAQVTDNTENVNVSISSNVDTSRPGEYSVTYIALDDYGNSSVQFRRVSVIDTTAPTILIDGTETLTDFTTVVYLGDEYEFPIATAIDNNARETLFVGDNGKSNVNFDIIGDYQITYNVQDSNNNATSIVQTISVRDSSPPNLTLNGDTTIEIEYGSDYIELGATSYNIQNNAVPITIVSDVCTNILGTYSVVYTSVAGEFVSQFRRTVIVKDSIAPTLTLIGDATYTLLAGEVFTDPGVNVSDNYDTPENINVSSSYLLNGNSVSELDTSILGNYTITYTANDTYNNVVSVTRQVNIIDNVAPTISLLGDSVIEVLKFETYNEPGYNISDNYDDIASITVRTQGTVITSVAGTYNLSYTAIDSNGNESNTLSRTVIVVDDTPPSVTLKDGNSNITHEVNTDFIDTGVIALDYTGSTISNDNITISYTLNGSSVNNIETNIVNRTYIITYTVTDSNNNKTTTITRTVNIVDTTPPLIQLNGSSFMNLNYQETFTDPGVTINDNYNNADEITTLINYTYQRTSLVNATDVNGIDTSVLGMYIITYTATDNNNNTSSITRTVLVEDTSNPIITLNGATTITLPLDSTYSEPGYNVSDNYTDTANINVNIITDLCTNIVGNYPITYIATDEEGNQSSVQRLVEIIDTIPPTVELNGNDPIIVELFNAYTEEGVTASDNVDPNNLLTTTINGTVNTSVAGSYTLTYSVSDTGGQTTNITRTVIVVEAPTVILTDGSANIFINQDFYYPNITSNDASGNELILQGGKDQLNQISNDHLNIQRNNDTFDNTISGIYNILYNITDAYNISRNIAFNVVVNDPASPTLTLTYNTTSLDLNATFDYPLVEGIDSYNNTLTLSGTSDQSIEISNDTLTITREGTVDTTIEGTYDISYQIITKYNTDLSASENVTFTVIDPTPPTLVISGEQPLYVLHNSGTNNIVSLPVANASRANGTDISDLIVVQNLVNFGNNTIDTSTIGTFPFNYSVTDPINNKTVTNVLIVYVTDNLSPTITLNGDSEVTITQSGFYNELGAEADDFDNTNISDSIIINTNNFDIDVIGSYSILYSITNSYGYIASVERTVIVTYVSSNYTLDMEYNGTNGFNVSGNDKNGSINSVNPTINLQTNDTITITNTSDNPLYIRDRNTTDNNYNVTGIINNGETNGIMTWTPDISGRYYYSSGDSLDGGIIQVTDHISERIKTYRIEVENMISTALYFNNRFTQNNPGTVPYDRLSARWGGAHVNPTSSYHNELDYTFYYRVNDTIEVERNNYPIYIKSVLETGTDNLVSDAINNETFNELMTWTMQNPGIYYLVREESNINIFVRMLVLPSYINEYSVHISDADNNTIDISGSDRTGRINGSGANNIITIELGDIIRWSTDFEWQDGHRLVMKTDQVAGESSLAVDRIQYEDGSPGGGEGGDHGDWDPNLMCMLVLMPGTYYYQDKNNVNGYITIIVNPKESSATHNLTVTTSGSNYILSGSDRNGNIDNVEHATININVQDVLNLDVNVSGHPLWIKTSQTTGQSDAVMDIPALNNGATSGTISWVPYNAGTYYYICQYHGSMVGTIIVS